MFKQGTRFPMTINVGYDLELVSKMLFKFEQGQTSLVFTYPSDNAVRIEDTNKVKLIWSIEDTFKFVADKPMTMDTWIKQTDSEYNPPTEKVPLVMAKTLFDEEELV